MSGVVQAPAPSTPALVMHPAPQPHDPRDLADVTVSTIDAMVVGLAMRSHAREKLTGQTAAAHMRVANQLIAAARRALAEGK